LSAARQKGTKYETSLLPLIRVYYPEARRSPLAGANDTGDFTIPGEDRFILQAKNRKRMVLSEWVEAAGIQAKRHHPEAVGVVVHKRLGVTDPADQYVTMKFGDFLWLVNHGRG
jgi:hypothetical protein